MGGGQVRIARRHLQEDNKARVPQGHSEYRDQVALAPETSGTLCRLQGWWRQTGHSLPICGKGHRSHAKPTSWKRQSSGHCGKHGAQQEVAVLLAAGFSWDGICSVGAEAIGLLTGGSGLGEAGLGPTDPKPASGGASGLLCGARLLGWG